MNITGDHWHIRPPELSRTQQSVSKRTAAEVQPNPAKASGSSDLHKAEELRTAVERLMESGDVKAGTDGAVRQSRVDRARQNSDTGAYARHDVLASIVDRLLDQWKI